MSKLRGAIIYIGSSALLFVLTVPAAGSLFAATGPGPSTALKNPLGETDTLAKFMDAFLKVVIQVAFPFLILAVVYTGFLFVKAQGNPTELEKAKKAFLWTVIGALIVLGAAAISELIQATTNEIVK